MAPWPETSLCEALRGQYRTIAARLRGGPSLPAGGGWGRCIRGGGEDQRLLSLLQPAGWGWLGSLYLGGQGFVRGLGWGSPVLELR